MTGLSINCTELNLEVWISGPLRNDCIFLGSINPLTFTTLIFVAGIKTVSCWSSLTLATSPWRTITLVLWLTRSMRVRTPASWGRRTRFWQPIRGSYGCASEDVKPQHEIVLTETTFWFCPKWVFHSLCQCCPYLTNGKKKVCDQVLYKRKRTNEM